MLQRLFSKCANRHILKGVMLQIVFQQLLQLFKAPDHGIRYFMIGDICLITRINEANMQFDS